MEPSRSMEGSRRWRRSGVGGGGVVRVDSGGWRREEERTCNTCVTLRQASRDESLVLFRGWQRDDAKAEKYLTRGKPDQGVWVRIFP